MMSNGTYGSAVCNIMPQTMSVAYFAKFIVDFHYLFPQWFEIVFRFTVIIHFAFEFGVEYDNYLGLFDCPKFNNPCGVSCSYLPSWDGFGNDGAGADDCAFTYGHAGENGGFGGDPGVIADSNWLSNEGHVRRGNVMRGCTEIGILGDDHFAADGDVVFVVDLDAWTDASPLSEGEVPGCIDADAGIDMAAVTEFGSEEAKVAGAQLVVGQEAKEPTECEPDEAAEAVVFWLYVAFDGKHFSCSR